MTDVIKHKDLSVDKDNPFQNCKLNRQQYAEILTNIVANYKDGFVLAVNNRWGTGKTTFIKMWAQYLQNNDFKTIYFNAWENDFENDPLVALISELKHLSNEKNTSLLNKTLTSALPLAKSLGVGLVKQQAEKWIGDEFVKEAVGSFTEEVAKGFKNQLNDYLQKKDSIRTFRDNLKKFVKGPSSDEKPQEKEKPLVFFIDELDRCRPNYAVEVLEKVKHLFSVKGIVFVLSIDKTQLENAICGFYGSDQIKADEYLRRFIDLEYSIPDPDPKLFCNYLYEVFDFKRVLHETDRENFHDKFHVLFSLNSISLREIEKIFAHLKVAISIFRDERIYLSLLFILLYFKKFESSFYKEIITRKLSTQELTTQFFNKTYGKIPVNRDYFDSLITQFTYSYNQYLENIFRVRFSHENGVLLAWKRGKKVSNYTSEINNDTFWKNYTSILNDQYTNFNLEKYIKSIEFADKVSFE